MIFPYLGRLACLALASFFIIHFLAALAVRCATPGALRLAQHLRPKLAARWLLVLRLAPAGLGILIVAGVCVPSYLWFEPELDTENVGLACLMASFCGIAVWALAAVRTMRALGRSRRITPLLGLAGILRPRLLIAPEVAATLSVDELDAALSHEEAHRISRDNLKRLFIVLSPGILPGISGFRNLERAWAKFAEWAADDFAVDGDERRSLSLASALVRVARLGEGKFSPCMTSLLGDPSDLSVRVDRLLHGAPPIEGPAGRKTLFIGFLAFALISAAFIFAPSTLSTVHNLLESLVR